MKKLFFLITFCFLFFVYAFAQQAPTIQWQKCFGSTGSEFCYGATLSYDGGVVMCGMTNQNGGDVSGLHTYADYWVMKSDSLGYLVWQICLGGTNYERAEDVIQTSDSGYIVAGTATSIDGDVTGCHGYYDFWITKVDGVGNLQWQKCLGGSEFDCAYKIIQVDSVYYVCGETRSTDGDILNNHGTDDACIFKLDINGNIIWQKCYGGTSGDYFTNIFLLPNGNLFASGRTYSNDGDVTGNHDLTGISTDVWVCIIDTAGNLLWQKCYGGTEFDRSQNSTFSIFDSSLYVVGNTGSNDGDVIGNSDTLGLTANQAWVFKIDLLGNLLWQKCMGGFAVDYFTSAITAADSSIVILGISNSNNNDVTGNHGNYDYWLSKLDGAGNIIYTKCYGGSQTEYGFQILSDSQNAYYLAGFTTSNDSDVSGNHQLYMHDYWLVKLIEDTITSIQSLSTTSNSILLYPNPTKNNLIIQTPQFKIENLKIFSTLGKEITISKNQIVKNKNETQLNISSLSSGIYLLRLTDEEGIFYSEKFGKE